MKSSTCFAIAALFAMIAAFGKVLPIAMEREDRRVIAEQEAWHAQDYPIKVDCNKLDCTNSVCIGQ